MPVEKVNHQTAEPTKPSDVPSWDSAYALWLDDCRVMMRQVCYEYDRLLEAAKTKVKAIRVGRQWEGPPGIKAMSKAMGLVELNEVELEEVQRNLAKRKALRDALGSRFGRREGERWGSFYERMSHPKMMPIVARLMVEMGYRKAYRKGQS